MQKTLSLACGTIVAVSLAIAQCANADSGTYNRQSAAAYSRHYATQSNPAYRRYSDGDCTSFVCQSLIAGGWGMVGTFLDLGDAYTWWYNPFLPNRSGWGLGSDTWSNADAFFRFLLGSGRAHPVSRASMLQIGDVVQMIWSNDQIGHIGHTAIVDSIGSDGTLYFAQHDTDKYDDTIQSYLNYDHGVRFIWWKIDNAYPSNDGIPLFRYYSGRLNDHFYTSDWNELGAGTSNYGFEFVECELLPFLTNGGVPLYRYYNSSTGDHFYTTQWSELRSGAGGYRLEASPGAVYPWQYPGSIPLYRYYNPSVGRHFYSTDPYEIGNDNFGYHLERIEAYVLP